MTDLLSVLNRHTTLELAGHADGGEYHGPCPFCRNGVDRFKAWPNADKPHYWCRQCRAWGDTVDALEKLDGMPRGQALRLAGVLGRNGRMAAESRSSLPPSRLAGSAATGTWAAKPPVTADTRWQLRAQQHIERCEEVLWSQDGAAALDYLCTRGLNSATIRHYRLGCNPSWSDGRWRAEPCSIWGLDAGRSGADEPCRVWMPEGILIPHLVRQEVHGINIRRFTAGKPDMRAGEKYRRIRGSQGVLFGVDDLRRDGRPLVLVEGEFDVMIVWQEGRDLVDGASILGAGNRLRPEWLELIACYHLVAVAYDADSAGQRGAESIVHQLTESGIPAIRVTVPGGRDINGYHQSGGDTRQWLKSMILKNDI